MKKVLFICHGNICRSPMAEFVMKNMVRKRGLEAEYEIASAATSREEIGNPYSRSRPVILSRARDRLHRPIDKYMEVSYREL